MSEECFQELYHVARQAMQQNAATKNYGGALLSTSRLGATELYPLACRVAGIKTLLNFEVLPVFFEEEAVPVLLSLPNPYWFWMVVQEAILCSDDDATRVSHSCVMAAMAILRRGASLSFDLTKPLDELTATEACARMAAGLLVVRSAGREHAVMPNPVFHP